MLGDQAAEAKSQPEHPGHGKDALSMYVSYCTAKGTCLMCGLSNKSLMLIQAVYFLVSACKLGEK